VAYNPKDYYFKKAKAENFVARSVYKLEEIDQRHKLFKSGQKVLDLGAAPGSWSQYLSKKVGESGKVLGIDLTPIKINLPNAVFVTADIESVNLEDIFKQHGFVPPLDSVVSDMAPNTTGIRSADQARSFALCEMALTVAMRMLKPGGSFVCKIFHGNEFEVLRKSMRSNFKTVDIIKPKGTRKESKEIFMIGLGFFK